MNEEVEDQSNTPLSDRRATNQAYQLGAQIGSMQEQLRQHALRHEGSEKRLDNVDRRVDGIQAHLNAQDRTTEEHFSKSDEVATRTTTSLERLATAFETQVTGDKAMRDHFITVSKKDEARSKTRARRSNILFAIGSALLTASILETINFIVNPVGLLAWAVLTTIFMGALVLLIYVYLRSKDDANISTTLGVH